MITVVRLTIGLLWVLSFLIGRGMWHSAAAPVPESSAIVGHTTSVSDGVGGELSSVGNDDEQPRFDLFGNEIESAVADYRFDRRGGVYERHSPDTAVEQLGSPVL
jgi:hypothetical protein